MGGRPIFLTISGIAVVGGLWLFFAERTKKKYDIEFTGGTSAQINLKDNVNLSRRDVERQNP